MCPSAKSLYNARKLGQLISPPSRPTPVSVVCDEHGTYLNMVEMKEVTLVYTSSPDSPLGKLRVGKGTIKGTGR